MSSSIDSLDVSSSSLGSGCFSVLGGIVRWTFGIKGSICSLTSYWSSFSPLMRGIKMSVYFALDYGGIG